MAIMVFVALIATVAKPTHLMASDYPEFNLETAIPKDFSDWSEINMGGNQVVNPEANALVNRIYTQVLTRAYINKSGTVVMLSIAYGENQSEESALHYPEICYPAQGFKIVNNKPSELITPFGNIRTKQIEAISNSRHEFITYWTMLGNNNVRGTKETKLMRLKFAFNNQIPDGLIFRVSTIGVVAQDESLVQEKFVTELINRLSAQDKKRIAALE
jgi:EpsI family protein